MVKGNVAVGALPDMVTFSADGKTILVANEGEQNTGGDNPEGSVSIINIAAGLGAATVTTAGFTAFNSQIAALKAEGVRLFAGNTGFESITVAQDLEPEYISISPDGKTALVTLQENNAVAILDLTTGQFVDIVPLGLKSFNGLAFDGSDKDGAGGTVLINPQTDQPVFGQYMPDAIASFVGADGRIFYVIANEGDDRDDFIDPNETARLSAVDLDNTLFPDEVTLKTNAELGRLNITNIAGNNGDIDADGDIDKILAYGARSFSILNDQGVMVFDSGSHIEQFMSSQGLFSAAYNTIVDKFNGGTITRDQMLRELSEAGLLTAGGFDDTRSDNKGSEPEGVTIGVVNGRTLAFVGLERGGGGVMVYDITDPTDVTFQQYLRYSGDISPEGLAFVGATDSPNQSDLVFVTNEVTGTVSVYNRTLTGNFNLAVTQQAAFSFASLEGVNGQAVFREIISAGEVMDGADLAGYDPYLLSGIMDGVGVLDNGNGTLTVLINHEIRDTVGAVRDHGSTGAYVSRLIVDKATLQVLSGEDFVGSPNDIFLATVNSGAVSWTSGTTTAFNRFCSGDLAEATAFKTGSAGYDGRIYLTGEESGAEGRALAHIVTGADAGKVFELPSLGNMSFENVVANHLAQTKTIVAATDDSGGGQVYIYVGEKNAAGANAVEQAGLSGGKLFGVKINGAGMTETGTDAKVTGLGLTNDAGTFSLVEMTDAVSKTGAEIETASNTAGVTQFLRPEDGAWSLDGKTFYFVTTASMTTASRLWALEFTDPTNPEAGGTVKLLLDGSEGHKMLDNMTVTDKGTLMLQEDPGNNAHLASIWNYNPLTDILTKVAQHDAALFSGANPLTQDEESSGIVDVSAFFTGVAGYDTDQFSYFMVADQIHKSVSTPGVVEMGQLAIMATPVL
jgi:hypothetical protein